MKKKGMFLVLCFIILFLTSACGTPQWDEYFSYNQHTKEFKQIKTVNVNDFLKGKTISKLNIILEPYDSNKPRVTLKVHDGAPMSSFSGFSATVDLPPGHVDVHIKADDYDEFRLYGSIFVENYDPEECGKYNKLSIGKCGLAGCKCSDFTGDTCNSCVAYHNTVYDAPENESNETIENDDCVGLYGKFLDDLKAGLKAFKIIGPIMVAIYTTVEYLNAVTNKDAEALKKANQRLISRIILLVMLFFLPTLIEILLQLVGVTSTTNCLK